eukprot:SAG31_NODE_13953_length_835_cov_1.259511_1_plen_212_part_01
MNKAVVSHATVTEQIKQAVRPLNLTFLQPGGINAAGCQSKADSATSDEATSKRLQEVRIPFMQHVYRSGDITLVEQEAKLQAAQNKQATFAAITSAMLNRADMIKALGRYDCPSREVSAQEATDGLREMLTNQIVRYKVSTDQDGRDRYGLMVIDNITGTGAGVDSECPDILSASGRRLLLRHHMFPKNSNKVVEGEMRFISRGEPTSDEIQ